MPCSSYTGFNFSASMAHQRGPPGSRRGYMLPPSGHTLRVPRAPWAPKARWAPPPWIPGPGPHSPPDVAPLDHWPPCPWPPNAHPPAPWPLGPRSPALPNLGQLFSVPNISQPNMCRWISGYIIVAVCTIRCPCDICRCPIVFRCSR